MRAVTTWIAAWFVAAFQAPVQDAVQDAGQEVGREVGREVGQEFVLEPATLRATVLGAAHARFPGEVSLDPEAFAGTPGGAWRLATRAPLTPAERLALATSTLGGDWTWAATERGARLLRNGAAEARLLDEILARETVALAERWGESRVESLERLARASELPLVVGVDVELRTRDAGRWAPARDARKLDERTVAATLDRLLGRGLASVARGGRIVVVTDARARMLAAAEAEEADLRARLAAGVPLDLEPADTLGKWLDELSGALRAPIRLAPDAGLSLDRTLPLGARASGRVPARAGLWLLEHGASLHACVVGDAVWLAAGERARVLRLGPWGDVLLEDELHRWPLALPDGERRLLDAPALVANEGLTIALEDHFRIALSRFDMDLAPPRVDTSTVAEVLDRLSSACGARGWHVHRGEIRFGPPPLASTASDDR